MTRPAITNSELAASLQPLVSRVRTDVTAVKNGQGVQAWTREPLTDPRLAKHLNGGPARGVCPIKAGESVTMVGLLDLDSHKGESTWEEMAAAAIAVCAELEARFMAPIPFRSSGGRGIHIYLLWDEPQDAYSVRQELTDALASLGYTNGTKGVKYNEIEVFPKQDSVPADGFGNQFILPLAGQSEPLDADMDPVGRDAALVMGWPSSSSVPKRERPVREVVAVEASGDMARVQSALDAIPNNGEHSLAYDEFRNIIFAVHHASGGSDEGKEMARAWAAKSEKHNDTFFEERVWPYIRDRDGGVTEQTLFAKAREHGWDRCVPTEFPADVTEDVAEAWPTFTRNKGRIETTISNVTLALGCPDFSGVRLGRDEFKDSTMVAWNCVGKWRPIRDTDYTEIRIKLEGRGMKAPGREMVRDAALRVAEENAFDSAIEWGNSLVWDGVRRVDTFLAKYFNTEATPYAMAVSRYLWTALAGRLLTPGEEVHMAVVLVGAQGSGKSRGVRALAPEPDSYVEINLEHRDDNLSRALRGKLVGELGELRGLQTKDAEAIKAWISRSFEEWTPKYMEFATKFPRRLVLIGTTNQDDFLADETGERRWLPIRVGATDLSGIERDRGQLWAEALALYRAGGVQWLEAQALAVDEHHEFKATDPWQTTIEHWLLQDEMDSDEGVPRGARPFKTETVMTLALGIEKKHQGLRDQKRVARVLRTLGYATRRATRAEGGKNVWVTAKNCTFDDLA